MTATVLLADDEELIREWLNEELESAGFSLVLVASGIEAFHELEGDPTRFRSVITDIKMGNGPDGWDVARRARELIPGIAVVYISGDSGADWGAKGVPNSLMLSKPFAPVQLVTAVATLINEADARKAADSSP